MMDKGVYDEPTVNLIETGGTHNCFAIDHKHMSNLTSSRYVLYLGGFLPIPLNVPLLSRHRFARGRVSDTLKQHWRSRFPACNVKRRNEPVATDTVFSDTPAVDCGMTAAQLFVGRESLLLMFMV